MKVFHFTSAKYALEAIESQQLKTAELEELNDPFELYAVELPDSRDRAALRSFKRKLAREFVLLCFSKNWRNPVLWSHYADKHRGVALEVEVPDDMARYVSYQSHRIALNIKNILSSGRLLEQDTHQLLTTKFEHWAYEEEVRVFLPKFDCIFEKNLFFYRLNNDIRITGLVHGPLCKITEGEIAKRLPESMEIDVVKGRLASKTFSVVPSRSVGKRTIEGKACQAP